MPARKFVCYVFGFSSLLITLVLLLFSIIPISHGAELSSGLEAHWKFDGNFLDESRSQYHLSNFGLSIENDQNGNPTGAVVGSKSTYANYNSSSIFQNVQTVAYWIRRQDPFSGVFIGAGSGNNVDRWEQYADSNTGEIRNLYLKDSESQWSFFNFGTSDRGWHHVATVFGTGGAKFYFDGELVDTRQTVEIPDSGFKSFYINSQTNDVGRNGSNARMDDVRLYSRQLSGSEIYSLYVLSETAVLSNNSRAIIEPTADDNDNVMVSATNQNTISTSGSLVDESEAISNSPIAEDFDQFKARNTQDSRGFNAPMGAVLGFFDPIFDFVEQSSEWNFLIHVAVLSILGIALAYFGWIVWWFAIAGFGAVAGWQIGIDKGYIAQISFSLIGAVLLLGLSGLFMLLVVILMIVAALFLVAPNPIAVLVLTFAALVWIRDKPLIGPILVTSLLGADLLSYVAVNVVAALFDSGSNRWLGDFNDFIGQALRLLGQGNLSTALLVEIAALIFVFFAVMISGFWFQYVVTKNLDED